jgi:hypothetical protein
LPRSDELIVVGREAIAIALAKLGKMMNFRVTVVDPLLEITDLPPGVRLLNTLDFSLARSLEEICGRGQPRQI